MFNYMSDSTPEEALDRIMKNIRAIVKSNAKYTEQTLKNFEFDAATVRKGLKQNV